jgi:hypothetical protein
MYEFLLNKKKCLLLYLKKNKDSNGNTKLAIAIKQHASKDKVLQLMRQCPSDILETNNGDAYSLQVACCYNQSETVVLLLLDEYPQAATEKDNKGLYQLH